MYPAELIAPMESQLTDAGVQNLKTAEQVSELLDQKEGSVLILVNSVCGCAAGNARPGVLDAIEKSEKKPTVSATVFAGVDPEATSKAREYMIPYPPSSPSIALFKDGKLEHMIERRHIEGSSADVLSTHLQKVFEHYC